MSVNMNYRQRTIDFVYFEKDKVGFDASQVIGFKTDANAKFIEIKLKNNIEYFLIYTTINEFLEIIDSIEAIKIHRAED